MDDDDEGEVVIGIRPKSSPLPRRKSSVSDEDSEPEPPLCGSRRVSFADAKGLSLVQVKEFDTWDVPKLPGFDSLEGEGKDAEEYFLSLFNFCLPLSTEELFIKVLEQKVELETIELLPGTTILKGVIRVLNISFNKAVYIRTTLDSWSSHFDLLAEYIPGSSDNSTDCFSFRLTLVPPFGDRGARVEFCLRYETPVGTFWANNNNRNYVLHCHQKMDKRKEKTQKENVDKKSCLKTVGQNFPTVEDISAMEASSQENISTDLSKQGEKVDTMKAKQISDVQSGTSDEDGQKLLAESRRNCSRRNRRKAARMARVRDIFAQRGGGANDTERDESPPEAKQATQEESPEQEQSFSVGSDKSGGSQFDSESLILDGAHDTSPAHGCTSNGESEKLESVNLADSTTLTGGESATRLPDKPLHSNDELAPAERQNINKSVSEAVESSQEQGVSYECTSNIAAEPADTVISAVSSESLVSKTDSFTFGTVVAPLYHQVFGRVGSESQSLGDPARATLNVGNLNQIYPHPAGREIGCTVKRGARDSNDKVQRNVIKTQEPDRECLHVSPNSPPIEEEETSLSVTENAGTLQDPDQRCTNAPEILKSISGDEVVQPHAKNITSTHVLNPQIPPESLHLQGETQEDDLTHDLQSQTTAETARTQLPEHTCAQIKTNLDERHAQNKTEELMASVETSFMSLTESQCVEESKKETLATNISREDRLLEACHDLNNIINSATKGTENSFVSCFEAVEEKIAAKQQISLKTHTESKNVEEENEKDKDETNSSADVKVIGEVAESMPESMTRHCHTHDISVELKDEDSLKDEEIFVSGKNERYKMEAAVSIQDGFCLADTTRGQKLGDDG
ncbi:Protein phosphatase 1 regulatory subunit 3A [Nibea albiflora]|uniref:Protein phosphatase 1 regulatory subunit 3A n=1 Tax=Nibea albiflora TaxID=240163 RepID=A0ACB7FEY0_NIBAL|nr:Protein phosphatase 1 regulatory subunit 3A [Nibea albiflora]